MNNQIRLVFFSLIFFLINNCSFYEGIPYAKERLISLGDNNEFVTKYYFPLGKTDSVGIFIEKIDSKPDYKSPIATYSMKETNDDLMLSEIIGDTVFIYYKNSKLKIKQELNKINKYIILFKLIKTKDYLYLKDSLKYDLGGYTLLEWL